MQNIFIHNGRPCSEIMVCQITDAPGGYQHMDTLLESSRWAYVKP